MIIIGEKLNGAIPSMSKIIEARDEEGVRDLVRRQVAAGANYLDICAGRAPEHEEEELRWLIDIVQSETDTPLCVDSPDPNLLKKIVPTVKGKGIINSVSGEGQKCEILSPVVQETGWAVVALTGANSGIPNEAEKKVEIAFSLIEKAATYGITPDRIYIDPLVLSVSAVNDAMLNFAQAIRTIKAQYPTVKFTSGLSNISFGMPYRKIINQIFMIMSMEAGMDSAIMDPTNRDLYASILATEVLLNKDPYCRKYNRAYRAGKIGPVKAN